MESKTYSNKSNATRAGGKLPEGTSYTVARLSDSDRWAITAHATDRTAAEAIAATGVAHSIVLAAAPEPVAGEYSHCPSCGTHLSNGVLHADDMCGERADTPRSQLDDCTHEWECMGCGHNFGEPVVRGTFQTVYNGYRAGGMSMCRALRWTAATYTGTRKDFIADAVALGMNANNVSAEWASYRRKGKR